MPKPDIELLKRCVGNDRRAHHELYMMSFGFLVSICKRYYKNPDDGKAVINNIFLKIIQHMDSYLNKDKNIPFELWMRRIAINTIIDEFRKNKSYSSHINLDLEYENEVAHPIAVDDVDSKEKLEVIMKAIEQLPEMNKAVFNLHVVDGYKHEEISELLNISINTSKVHLFRAKEKLKTLLKNEVRIGNTKKELLHEGTK